MGVDEIACVNSTSSGLAGEIFLRFGVHSITEESKTLGEGNTKPGGRQALDEIMGRMAEPDFTVRHRRVPEIPETGAHVSPEMLAMISPKSRYVRRWKRHARRCLPCANVFRYYGISLD